MIISLETEGKMITIYEGRPRIDVLEALKKARSFFIGGLEKIESIEGRYYLEIREGEEIQKYDVPNNYWIYDEINDKTLRCELVEPLRDVLFMYCQANNLLFW